MPSLLTALPKSRQKAYEIVLSCVKDTRVLEPALLPMWELQAQRPSTDSPYSRNRDLENNWLSQT
ncbi:hypothetical protein BGHDH14_bgh00846 [Blumeria hordei DH14]|uniref:Uncharacterized protein n=1 Tax=Blumeria graminis f. sp. hordei (strain DH14) TaxID=546991 RepID=N1J8Y5_BLUG1|nr:hypothetical protein BGHDH14_bgh00846 [Blumeria hordei DH14]